VTAAAAAAPAAGGHPSVHAPAPQASSGNRAGPAATPLLPGPGALAGTAAGCQALARGAAGAVAGAAAGLRVSVRVRPTGEPAGVGEREMNSWTWRSHGEAATCGARGPGHRPRRARGTGAAARRAAATPRRALPGAHHVCYYVCQAQSWETRSRPATLLGSCGAQRTRRTALALGSSARPRGGVGPSPGVGRPEPGVRTCCLTALRGDRTGGAKRSRAGIGPGSSPSLSEQRASARRGDAAPSAAACAADPGSRAPAQRISMSAARPPSASRQAKPCSDPCARCAARRPASAACLRAVRGVGAMLQGTACMSTPCCLEAHMPWQYTQLAPFLLRPRLRIQSPPAARAPLVVSTTPLWRHAQCSLT